ncbi:translation elongation factor Ts [Rhodospira trueperi]|uniref:Elongation factor Ts n=1 Tax=Rhodospira trueperi TaxID=69960 RepID=A0A1G7FTA8_9PROT|nr:translation elongation factor Ts [Rhodospira trueperi]SDE79134.1 elongation factor Ts [Rhodospira trueperi]
MAEITASMVKDLREQTGAGMMDCKKALNESGGDMDAAVDWLRKKGLAAAAKKAGRVAAEGLVAVKTDGRRGAVVELNAETDFVARNDTFQGLVETLGDLVLSEGDDLDALRGKAFPGSGRTVGEELTHQVATIGENMNLRRAAVLEVGAGIVAGYVHNAVRPGLGRIGVLVALESEGDAARLGELGKNLAMHVAAAAPQYLNRDEVDTAALDRERAVLTEQARDSGKPENIIEKMVEGRLRKYYEEICLLDQTYVMDNETKVAKVVEAAAKDIGAPVTLSAFVRFNLGEGIEKEEKDFAEEVAQQLNK